MCSAKRKDDCTHRLSRSRFRSIRSALLAPQRLFFVCLLLALVLYIGDLHATLNLTTVKYPKRNGLCQYRTSRFENEYNYLVQRKPALDLAKPHHGIFRVENQDLLKLSWGNCLPIRTEECGLYIGSESSIFDLPEDGIKCRSAVLHHLLTETTNALEKLGFIGVLSGSTLKHIVSYGALSPRNFSIEIATDANIDLSTWLWEYGLAHFNDAKVGPVTCIAAHHPLASKMYAAKSPVVKGPSSLAPFVQWTTFSPKSILHGDMNYIHNSQSHVVIPRNYIFPLSCQNLYDVSVQVPHYAPALYSINQTIESYPSTSCEAYCDKVKFEPKNTLPNFPNCQIQQDEVFELKLKEYMKQNVQLELSENHHLDLEPFTKNETKLRAGKPWQYCLPIRPIQCGVQRGNKSTLFETPIGRPCRSAVLHLLVDDLMDALNKDFQVAFPYFGTLLGAWRDQAIIPHTPDADIAVPYQIDWDDLQDVMWERGYYLFQRAIHAACIAPHHPLAPLLYASEAQETDSPDAGTPFVDLYMWWGVPNGSVNGPKIHVQTAAEELPREMIFPLTCNQKLYQSPIPTIHFPEGMFISEYGTSYVKDTKLFNQCELYCD
ncbi:hypothetical protein THRCLA_02892 [Thraustotheca clavata]|uniref:Uncharacterized protein n=1 Tax=Thraustotheca clavata TaxID=74557 RepID=A0A1W0A4E3_9STRA|nr:hypothetical protein THRCLA_02892 [Thraustotheca clavata]